MLLVTTGIHADPRHPTKPKPAISASQTIKGLAQAQQRVDGALVAKGRVSGTGAINTKHVIIEGVLAPGNSPGCITFGGDVTFSPSATMSMEIGGLTPCAEHDQIDVANQLTINSAALEVILIDGFVPAYGDTFDILNWGGFGGSFGTIDSSAASLPAPLVWDISQLYVTGELVIGIQQFADGDLNQDGVTNIADYIIGLRIMTGQVVPDVLHLAHGDIHPAGAPDGVINISDILLLRQLF